MGDIESRPQETDSTSNSMNAIAFDTLKFVKRLKEAGFTEQQAEALATAEAEFV